MVKGEKAVYIYVEIPNDQFPILHIVSNTRMSGTVKERSDSLEFHHQAKQMRKQPLIRSLIGNNICQTLYSLRKLHMKKLIITSFRRLK